MDLKAFSYEGLSSGHLACAGCGAVLAMRLALKAIGSNARVVIPASCWSIIAGRHPDASLKVPMMHSTFEVAPSIASGMRAALNRLGLKDTVVMVWAGDGATYDIGFASLSAAAERNEDIIYVCYDNEAYMNTGIQRSSSTPPGAWTTTTPEGKLEEKKNIILAMYAHRIPYIATATVAYPEDFIAKFQKAKRIKGFRFILVLSPCPTGWRFEEKRTVEVARLAVETGVFPLLEIENGAWRITKEPMWLPVDRYLKVQSRFAKASTESFERSVKENWRFLERFL